MMSQPPPPPPWMTFDPDCPIAHAGGSLGKANEETHRGGERDRQMQRDVCVCVSPYKMLNMLGFSLFLLKSTAHLKVFIILKTRKRCVAGVADVKPESCTAPPSAS